MDEKSNGKLTITQIRQIETLKYLKAFEIDYLDKKGSLKKWELVSRHGEDRLKDEINNGALYSDGAMIFATNRDKTHVVMLKEFRVSAGHYVYMLPAGLSDSGESLKVTSKREFKEETGLDFEYVSHSKPRFVSVGIVNERIEIAYGFYSGNVSDAFQSDEEDAEVVFVDREMAKSLLASEDVSVRSALLLEHFFNLNEFFDRS